MSLRRWGPLGMDDKANLMFKLTSSFPFISYNKSQKQIYPLQLIIKWCLVDWNTDFTIYLVYVAGIMMVSSGELYPNIKKISAELTGVPWTYLSAQIYTYLNIYVQIYELLATELNISTILKVWGR